MDGNGFKLYNIILNGSKLFKMIQNGEKGEIMITIYLKYINMEYIGANIKMFNLNLSSMPLKK